MVHHLPRNGLTTNGLNHTTTCTKWCTVLTVEKTYTARNLGVSKHCKPLIFNNKPCWHNYC